MPVDGYEMLSRLAVHVPHTPFAVSGETIDVSAVAPLLRTLELRGGINELSLHGCEMSEACLSALMTGLSQKGHCVNALQLSGLSLKYDASVHIARLLKDPESRIIMLRLGFNGIGEGSAALIAEAIVDKTLVVRGKTATTTAGGAGKGVAERASSPGPADFAVGCLLLDLQNNRLHDLGLIALAPAVSSTLVTLNISDNHIAGADGCRALAAQLGSPSGRALRSLLMDRNEIGDIGVAALAEGLVRNTTLERLHLAANRLSNDGAGALARIVAHPGSALTELVISRNPDIGSEGVRLIAEALQSADNRLQVWKASEVDAGIAGTTAIAQALRSPHCALRELHLVGNDMYADGCNALAAAIAAGGTTLRRLLLRGNTITDPGAVALLNVLGTPQGRLLEELELRDNDLGAEAVKALCRALGSPHCGLQVVDLSESLGTEGRWALWSSELATAILHASALRLLLGIPSVLVDAAIRTRATGSTLGSVAKRILSSKEACGGIDGSSGKPNNQVAAPELAITPPSADVVATWTAVFEALTCREAAYREEAADGSFLAASRLLWRLGDELALATAVRSDVKKAAKEDQQTASAALRPCVSGSAEVRVTEQLLDRFHRHALRALAVLPADSSCS